MESKLEFERKKNKAGYHRQGETSKKCKNIDHTGRRIIFFMQQN
jgi:hypothetical protein